MKNNWYYNNPYMYLIIKESNENMPVFVYSEQMAIPIFLDFNNAESFNDKFLGGNGKVIVVDMLNGVKIIEKILMNNNYIPQIALYDKSLSIIDSKEFIEDFYQYKESYNDILKQVISKDNIISNDTLITLLMYSPIYVAISSITDNSYYKVVKDEEGILLGIQHVTGADAELFTDNNDNILLFTDPKLFEKYKKDNDFLDINLKKYWDVFDLLDDIEKHNEQFKTIIVDPNSLNRKLFIGELIDYLAFKNQNMLN